MFINIPRISGSNSVQKPRKIYGRPKTRNPFFSNYFQTNDLMVRTPLFNPECKVIPTNQKLYRNRVSSTEMYSAFYTNPHNNQKVILKNERMNAEYQQNVGHQHFMVPGKWKVGVEQKVNNLFKTATNEQQENLPYEVTFYKPKDKKEDIKEQGLDRIIKLTTPVKTKPQTTMQ